MKKMNRTILNKWLSSMASNEAYLRLMNTTGLSVSTLQKILAGTYPSELKEHTRKAFAETLGLPEHKLWKDE
jgi:hypothetical protein